jgi:hypothetical protein
MRSAPKVERCAICNCELHRLRGTYARPTIEGRSHATEHHYVAERFFGRSANRSGEARERIFTECPWRVEGITAVFCYECHEELLHNPVLLASDIERFARLVKQRGFAEDQKTESRTKLAGRIQLLHEVIAAGIDALSNRNNK